MSLTSRIVLGCSAAFGAGVTVWVFYNQEQDRKKMHQGVVRDMERQKFNYLEKQQKLEQQINIPKIISAENGDDKVLRELVGANKS